jgi:DNA mismatch repair protein MutS
VELLLPEGGASEDITASLSWFASPPSLHELDSHSFHLDTATARLKRHLGTLFLDGFGLAGYTLGLQAAGAILAYLEQNRTGSPRHLTRLLPYSREDFLGLDEATVRNLENFENFRSRSRRHSLLDILDTTLTPMGVSWPPGSAFPSKTRPPSRPASRPWLFSKTRPSSARNGADY